VEDIASDFEKTAWSEDGILVAIEYRKSSFIVGVQWHPEDLWENNESHRELFKKFVEVCTKNI
jgi:putative glutamine amidotransferase